MVERRHPQAHAPALGSGLSSLGRDLNKSRTRAWRLWRKYQSIDEELDRMPRTLHTAHGPRRWRRRSSVADAISREPAHTLDDLLIQFEAIWWWIIEDDSILDSSTAGG